jgi:hypothetical protein
MASGYLEALESAKQIIGSFRSIGRVCGGISGEAVRRWAMRGCPPRTEYTGETDYATAISLATGGAVKPEELRPAKRKPKGWKKAA